MSYSTRARVAGATALLAVSFWAAPAFAQTDLSGQWQAFNMNDARTRGPGPDLVDYLGIPLNDEGRISALTYSYSITHLTERMCTDWSENYIAFAPHNIMIDKIFDPVTGDTLAVRVGAGGSDRAPLPIWLDGRPRPGPNAARDWAGFTLGEWNGGVLSGYMTHMKRGISARNGAPLSDRATMEIHLVRHDDMLALMIVTDDPIYFEAPYPQAGAYRYNPLGNAAPVNPPCYPLSEVPSLDKPGTVPHYLPGQNPYEQEFAKAHNLPLQSVLGGAATMYPEHRKTLKDKYTIPPPCRIPGDARLTACRPISATEP
jgi:hypothetical protein